jgi:hypothetical protein
MTYPCDAQDIFTNSASSSSLASAPIQTSFKTFPFQVRINLGSVEHVPVNSVDLA